jgi:hypothetical protein
MEKPSISSKNASRRNHQWLQPERALTVAILPSACANFSGIASFSRTSRGNSLVAGNDSQRCVGNEKTAVGAKKVFKFPALFPCSRAEPASDS